jgi:hypothetical protein
MLLSVHGLVTHLPKKVWIHIDTLSCKVETHFKTHPFSLEVDIDHLHSIF